MILCVRALEQGATGILVQDEEKINQTPIG